MRLIDADALIDEAMADGAYGYVDAKQIADAPTIDAVPVVMCKDCKWWIPHGKGTPASIPALGECGYKKFSGCLTMLCEFCLWGERKDDE